MGRAISVIRGLDLLVSRGVREVLGLFIPNIITGLSREEYFKENFGIPVLNIWLQV